MTEQATMNQTTETKKKFDTHDYEFPMGYPISHLAKEAEHVLILDANGIFNVGQLIKYREDHPNMEGIDLPQEVFDQLFHDIEEAKKLFKPAV